MRISLFRCVTRAVVGACALLAMSNGYAQSLHIVAANASNDLVYTVTFSGTGGSVTPLNTDQSSRKSIRSLVHIANTATGQIDLLITDTLGGQVLRYANSSGNAVPLTPGPSCPPSSGTPSAPDGISLDSDGNLFVVSSASGASTAAQLWVFPRDSTVPLGSGFCGPRLVDSSFAGTAVQLLEETTVAQSASTVVGAGDLLVLSSTPAALFVYSAASIRSFLAGSVTTIAPPTMLIGSSPSAMASFPVGSQPAGVAFWPLDGSLLITTGDGRILRYAPGIASATLAQMPDFAFGLGNGKFKIKTGRENSAALAIVANNNGGDILKFGNPPATGQNLPLAIVTRSVERPQGLAVTNMAAGDSNQCLESSGGCDLLGGILKHQVRNISALPGFIIENVCVVQKDPRLQQYGTCTGHSLPAAQVCAGFGTAVIPDFLCGGSGESGGGFALISTTTNQLNYAGSLVVSDGFPQNVLNSSFNQPCPATVLAWLPQPGEGSIVEGNVLQEFTGACDDARSTTRTASLWGVGLEFNAGAFPTGVAGYATVKYNSLSSTITASSFNDSVFMTAVSTCVSDSRALFDKNKLVKAAAQLKTCDQLVAANPGKFVSTIANPNPYGELRGRFANLFLIIDVRMLGHTPQTDWP